MLIVALVMMQVAIFATTIYLHRGLAHRGPEVFGSLLV
jgi:fatty-acid desaturase